MFFELKKIWKNRWIVCIVLFFVFINGIMFYRECTNNLQGYTFTDIKEKYNNLENIEDEYKWLVNWFKNKNTQSFFNTDIHTYKNTVLKQYENKEISYIYLKN